MSWVKSEGWAILLGLLITIGYLKTTLAKNQ
jgi:hypothetical protein